MKGMFIMNRYNGNKLYTETTEELKKLEKVLELVMNK